MVDDGAQDGPMVTWTHVAAMPGAHEALHRLRPRYRLVVATNAEESGVQEVRAALTRVGLDALVDDVVSSRDVGARKPDPAFFRAALRAASVGQPPAPRRAVMVGDSWSNDVAGARAAGLRAVWLNPSRAGRPCGAPGPDAEIRGLFELPRALEGLDCPPGDRRAHDWERGSPGRRLCPESRALQLCKLDSVIEARHDLVAPQYEERFEESGGHALTAHAEAKRREHRLGLGLEETR